MLCTTIRSPLTSPALRPAMSASSKVSFPFHHAVPRPHLPHAKMSQSNILGSPRTPRHMSPNLSASPTFGEYFDLGLSSKSSLGLPFTHASPQVSPSEIAVDTSALKYDTTPREVIQGTRPEFSIAKTMVQNTETRDESHNLNGRRPLLKLGLPSPTSTLVRNDSFEAVALAGVSFTLGSPGELEWSDSFDSIMTLKPTKGRVQTPYPKSDGEWIEDADLAIRENFQTLIV